VARTRADTLAIGLDASADALAYAARCAVREPVPNLVLLREPLESLALDSFADELTIHFPWGSLLSGALAARTSTLRLGTLVSPVTFRDPAVLARAALTVI